MHSGRFELSLPAVCRPSSDSHSNKNSLPYDSLANHMTQQQELDLGFPGKDKPADTWKPNETNSDILPLRAVLNPDDLLRLAPGD